MKHLDRRGAETDERSEGTHVSIILNFSVASTGSATAMLLCNMTKVHASVIDKTNKFI
jgi:hypothetical protein